MPAQTLSNVLDEITAKVEGDATPETLTLGEVLAAFGRRSYGPLLLVIGLFAISPATIVPGLTWLAAALTLVVAGQMALGLKRVWLPRSALQAELPRDAVLGGIEKSRGFANRIDGLLKPRLTFLSGPPFVNVVALLCIAAALGGIKKSRGFATRIDGLLKPRLTFLSGPPFVNVVALLCIAAALITFPLGLIPFAPLAPGIAVVFFGLGMVARDGLWLLLGTAFVGGAIWLATQVIL
jgi:hypothetical protein